MKSPFAVVVCLLPLLLSGCGTLVNLSRLPGHDGGMQPYGGVAIDLELADEKHDAAMKDPPRRNFENVHGNQCALLLADAPLSFVGDTVTLPIAILAVRHQERQEERKRKQEVWDRFWVGGGTESTPSPSAPEEPPSRGQ